MDQKNYCNTPELLTREARWLLIFDKNELTYNNNYKGKIPNLEKFLFKIHIQEVKSFIRSVKNKTTNSNSFNEINLSVRYFSLNDKYINELFEFQGRNKYVVVLISNENIEVFGNHREPMSFRIYDDIKDNGSGKDCYNLSLTGITTIQNTVSTKINNSMQNTVFRVLLYGNPIS